MKNMMFCRFAWVLLASTLWATVFTGQAATADPNILLGKPAIVDQEVGGTDITDNLQAGDTISWVSVTITNKHSATIDPLTRDVKCWFEFEGTNITSKETVVTVSNSTSKTVVFPTTTPKPIITATNNNLYVYTDKTPSLGEARQFDIVPPTDITVTFDAQDGTTPIPPNITVTNGSAYGPLATTTRAGYIFDHWYTNATYVGSAITNASIVTATNSHTLYAKWTALTYAVTFDPQGGTPVPTAITVTFDTAYGPLPEPQRAGFAFGGWWANATYAGSAITNASIVTATNSHTLYAKWRPIITVTFDPQGGTLPAPATITVTNGLPYGTLATTTRPGFAFGGWYTNTTDAGSLIMATSLVTAVTNHTLYATWSATPPIIVTFDPQGGDPVSAITVTNGLPYGPLATATRTGYTFADWWTEAGGAGTEVTAATVVSAAANHALYAKWTALTYAVSYNVNGATGGAAPSSQTKTNDVTLTLAINSGTLEKLGYTFTGWNTTATGAGTDYAVGASYAINAAATLYAKWTALTYAVSYNANDATGGTAPPLQTKTHDVALTLAINSGTLEKLGYTFAGWNTATNGAGTDYAAGASYGINAAATLYVKWMANSYTISFDAQSGTAPNPVGKSATYGAAYGALATTTRAGYTFAGWWTEDSGTGTEVTAATVVATASTHTLYAKWHANPPLTVTFDPQGGTDSAPTTITVTNGLPYGPLAVTTRAGHTLSSWCPNAVVEMGSSVTAASIVAATNNHTLYAQWTPNTYTVTLDPQGGTVDPTSSTVTFGTAYGTLSKATRVGYTFADWYTNAAYMGSVVTTASVVTATNDHVLYAKWHINPALTVTFDPQGGADPMPTFITVTNGFPYGPLATNTFEGYTLAGWQTDVADASSMVTATSVVAIVTNHTLYAQWTPNTYTATFDPQGGMVDPTQATVTFGEAYGSLLPLPTRAGYTFTDWYTNAAYTGSMIAATSVVSTVTDHTLYAKWTLNPVMTVTFEPQHGTDSVPTSLIVTNGLAYGPLAVTTRAGYTFAGWQWATGSNLIFSNTVVTANSDHSLYAKWTPNIYMVTFDAQGGTVAAVSNRVTFGNSYGALPVPGRPGYPPFEGWWTGENGSGQQVTASTRLNTATDHTLYAKWHYERFGSYLVIDLSGGATAVGYPVTYLARAPAGGWTSAHKTTHLVLKRIRASDFMMGSPILELGHQKDEVGHSVTFGKDFFVGLFPVTQSQWRRVMGANPSRFTNGDTAETRPVEQVTYVDIRETQGSAGAPVAAWPANSAVGADSFMGRLRAKTGVATFDLPTEAQWEYSCRAGTGTALNSGKNLTSPSADVEMSVVGHYLFSQKQESITTAAVGAYKPNAWGLYDFHGNVWEWCLDWYAPYSGNVTNPPGAATGKNRIVRGGGWNSLASLCRSGHRNSAVPDFSADFIGFRVASALPEFSLTVMGGMGSGWFSAGAVQPIVAETPTAGHRFAHWVVEPTTASLGTAFVATHATTTITMPTSDVVITAVYSPIVVMTVTFDARGGTVLPGSKTVTNGGTYGTLPLPALTGFVFSGWYTNTALTGVKITATTTVTATTGHILYAQWTEQGGGTLCDPSTDAVLTSAGAYDGFFYGENAFDGAPAMAVAGTLTLKVSNPSGKLTAKVELQNSRLSFRASAWTAEEDNGTFQATLYARSGETLELSVRQNRIWGTLTGGTVGDETLTLDGGRNRFADRGDAAAAARLEQFSGYYTVALPTRDSVSASAAVDAAPHGSGYLAITIRSQGSVKIAGVLADGTRVSCSSRLILFDDCGDAACVPLFAPLYRKQGWTGGLLWLDPSTRTVVTARDQGWFIRWENPGKGPDGFSMLLDTSGGFYSSINALAAQYLFTADADVPYRHTEGSEHAVALPEALPATVVGTRLSLPRGLRPKRVRGEDRTTWYEYDEVNPTQASLSFAARTGIFKGRFTLYYDYEAGGRAQHKNMRASCAGILTPLRDEAFADLPAGMGHCLVRDNDPAVKAYRLTRSYPVWLDAE